MTSTDRPDGRGKTLVPGHTLRYEGEPMRIPESDDRLLPAGVGRGKCSCGEYSAVFNSKAERKRWHSQHKAEIAARVGAV